MGFDKDTRNRLSHFVANARTLLKEDIEYQLKAIYGIGLDGTIHSTDTLTALDEPGLQLAHTLRERISYLARTHTSEKTPEACSQKAIEQLAREQAFTVLNRLAAIRMAEKRSIVQESVAKGYQSRGFKVFGSLAGSSLGEIYSRYLQYIHCLFNELAIDLGALFDLKSPQGLLFPRENCLISVLELFNSPDLEALWAEDEAVGWIYQYYNDPAERKEMRKSSAPRNSRELAVRNQFFTPRYVVEFLTDNTLGRIWYEMCQGQTKLKDRCRYLVRSPNEIFLKESEAAPEQPNQENLSQEELLKQTVYIPHRQLKDPRTILMLDPACGSMHFGLYAFDLFEEIYHEAWDREEQNKGALLRPKGMKSLHQIYANKTLLLVDIPRLIIEHNIHGVDIDPRATQIAALSLWLRAHRTWNDQKTPLVDRPRITKSNIVCAEPMPGDLALLQEFVKDSFSVSDQPLFQHLLEQIFEKMQLAGEAGSLLKIEEEITSAVEEAKAAWAKSSPAYKGLFGTAEMNAAKKPGSRPELPGMDTALSALDVTTDFWEHIEERIYSTLRDYAEQAETGGGFQRRLFAEDAARGFAFIDVCRKRYDVALMNPPFGDATLSTRNYVDGAYSDSKSDIGMAFISCSTVRIIAHGRLGAITNRVFIANETLNTWRDNYLLGIKSVLNCLLDLGYGVLDDAMVEAAAFVTDRQNVNKSYSTFIRVLDALDKEPTASAILTGQTNPRGGFVFHRRLDSFTTLPGHVLAYQLPLSLVHRITDGQTLSFLGGKAVVGLQPSDDFRFVRLAWEVSPEKIGRSRAWPYYAKGGEYQPYWDDIHLVVSWANDGIEIRSFAFPNGKVRSYVRNPKFYFSAGVTYPERTTSDFSPRVLPQDCIFSGNGQGVFCGNRTRDLAYIAGAYSRAFKLIVDAIYGSGDASVPGSAATHYRSAVLARIPPPIWACAPEISDNALRLVREGMEVFSADETSRYFVRAVEGISTIRQQVDNEIKETALRVCRILSDHAIIDSSAFDELGFGSSDRKAVDLMLGPHPLAYADNLGKVDINQVGALWKMSESELIRAATSKLGARRQVTKKSYAANRRFELIAHTLEVDARLIASIVSEKLFREPNIEVEVCARNLSWVLGITFGRWDIRYATGERAAPELPDPFAPLPVCPPGQLQNAQGLPARPEDVPANYHLKNIRWDGILVDDPNHSLDIEHRICEVIKIIWSGKEGGPNAEAIEHEACEILGVKSLRDYFRKPAGFFADHLKRYSKSRRQAPIYWPLSTKSGSYTLWIYYHRLTDQTLHTCLADFVNEKLKSIEIEIGNLRESKITGERLENLLEFKQELSDFQAELEEIIKLPWKPNLNDGVLINAAPLWKLFRLPAWQKKLKTTWEELKKGDYDWAHLAYTIWPERVKDACKTDRSMAIAHGLEHLCTIKAPKAKRKVKASFEDEAEIDLFSNAPEIEEAEDSITIPPKGKKNIAKKPIASEKVTRPRGRPAKTPKSDNPLGDK